jgi:hypothetical protein
MIYIQNKEELIGDFLGTVPALQELAKTDKLVVQVTEGSRQLLPIIDNPNDIVFTDVLTGEKKYTLDCQPAFSRATGNDWYMSQAFFEQLGLSVPSVAPKAKLKVEHIDVPIYDYIISPFARSLPEEQKWSRKNWQALIDSMVDKKFCVIGTMKYDERFYLNGSENVDTIFDKNFNYVCNLLLRSTRGLISVVTGTSHLAFHLGVKNWILNNQDFKWGTNPDGISIRTPIPQLTVKEVRKYLEDSK